ncbi:MAG: N-6 DNA methylase [Sulfuricella sp.]|jgi:type I restriction enzyme M protein
MLDTDTKRRIDSCRDILVGKVPDPKSQVEQITIALIYKFMDDMDAEAEELGGARSFFAGDYAKYGWAKLMAPSMGGFDVLALYSEAIGKMNENPGVPPLFRDIFKNAYLPYRDPETLRSFLKEINGFTYDHSERLGDAFEYLLSVLGSQGDAGQFRTPRHIIDFMVEIVDPKKNESILDPACGTAGFLISAWKHILKHNTKERSGDLLTPDERQYLAANIHGYDISPDMVRLSLVNLYLHGFTDPHVVEYDTLTSEEKWNETADIILANPPFMSPKGGIKPHKRFSVQASRSEVLFVDYMAEHLSPQGRAAIVVPEGIIFQSGTAYKQLREMLVKNSLVAVVSLPAGVFNPYSGVKTSILILDKRLAKTTDSVLFVKVENDGYNLGAQRRAVTGSGLPEAQRHLREFFSNAEAFENSAMAHKVERARIGENGEWNLSGERYRDRETTASEYPHVPLATIAEIAAGNSAPQDAKYFENGKFRFVRTSDVGAVHLSDSFASSADRLNELAVEELRLRLFPPGTILFPKSGASTFLNHRVVLKESAYVSSHLAAIICDLSKALPAFVYRLLCEIDARTLTPDQAYPSLKLPDIGGISIPLPPLKIQEEIVAEIEGYQKIIDGARQVVENYRSRINVQPDWPLIPLSELFSTKSGTTPRRDNPAYFSGGHIPWVKTLDLSDGPIHDTEERVTDLALAETHLEILPKGTVLIAMYGGFNQIGRTGVLEIGAVHNQAMTALLPTPKVEPYYLNAIFVSFREHWKTVANSTRKDPNITKSDVINFLLPLPDIDTQRAIVTEIEAEQALVNANKELITRFEVKIKAAINRVWSEAE